jgi:hypothetical protein
VFREEHRPMRVFERRVLRKMFGPKRGDVCRLYNEELPYLYLSEI